jgi:hypothetical protein
MPDALKMLKDDHRKVQDLFKEFEEAEEASQKKQIVALVIQELEIHSQIEEEIFYPAVRDEAEPDSEIMEEAEEEHHVVDTIIAELKKMRPTANNYSAKFKVLAENVKHHIQEEESMMLPKAAELGSGRMAELGDEMQERKMELMRTYGSPSRNGASSRRSGNGRTSTRRTTTRARAGTTRHSASRTTTRKRTTRARPSASRGANASRRTAAGARSVARRAGGTARAGTRRTARRGGATTRARRR